MQPLLSCSFRDAPGKVFEITGVREILVDRRKPDVGNVIEALQRIHDHFANACGRNLAFTKGFQLSLDAGNQTLDPGRVHRAFSTRDCDGALELFPLESLLASLGLENGQFPQLHALKGCKARAARFALPTSADRAIVLGWTAVLDLRFRVGTERAAQVLKPRIDWKARAQGANALAHIVLDLCIPGFAVPGQTIQHIGDHVSDFPKLDGAKSARGAGGRTNPDSRCLDRGKRVVWYSILVTGDAGPLKRLICIAACHAKRGKIDERKMRVSSA